MHYFYSVLFPSPNEASSFYRSLILPTYDRWLKSDTYLGSLVVIFINLVWLLYSRSTYAGEESGVTKWSGQETAILKTPGVEDGSPRAGGVPLAGKPYKWVKGHKASRSCQAGMAEIYLCSNILVIWSWTFKEFLGHLNVSQIIKIFMNNALFINNTLLADANVHININSLDEAIRGFVNIAGATSLALFNQRATAVGFSG